MLLPHKPNHLVQRGHNQEVVFARAEDYKQCLEELSSALDVWVYAYCLMPNHLNPLLRPGQGEEVARRWAG